MPLNVFIPNRGFQQPLTHISTLTLFEQNLHYIFLYQVHWRLSIIPVCVFYSWGEKITFRLGKFEKKLPIMDIPCSPPPKIDFTLIAERVNIVPVFCCEKWKHIVTTLFVCGISGRECNWKLRLLFCVLSINAQALSWFVEAAVWWWELHVLGQG